MQPINNFQKEAENEKITFVYDSNVPTCYPYRVEETLTVNEIIKGYVYRIFQEAYYDAGLGWIKSDQPKYKRFYELFPTGKTIFNPNDGRDIAEYNRLYLSGFYKDMGIATAKKLIEINLARLVSEDSEKNEKAELLNVKNLLLEEQVNSQVAQSSIENLKNSKIKILKNLNLVITEKNEIQDELDQEHLKLEEAQSLTQEQKALIDNQNAEINLLKRTMEEMFTLINSLKDEKLIVSLENIGLKSTFQIEENEYKRRILELEKANNSLVFELCGSTKSKENSYATSDDEGENGILTYQT
ncbi:MAG: hypothetical protein H0T62_01660 [Parachlamydiaceae bacterium]|nr:hypothetical protein [Parachlamydiaceae bacterium]